MMKLSPVRRDNGFRVPVYRDGNMHIVFVGDYHRRFFTTDTLPDGIKLKLSMISALATDRVLINEPPVTSEQAFRLTLYMTVPKEGFEDIGWQLSERYFVVILSSKELEVLKGDTGS
jgi:hypothetical protein